MQRNELLHQIEVLDGTRIDLEKKLNELRIRRKNTYDQLRYYSDLETRVFNHIMTKEQVEKHTAQLAEDLNDYQRRIKSIKRDIVEIASELDELRYKARTRYFDQSGFYVPNEELEYDIVSYYYGRYLY